MGLGIRLKAVEIDTLYLKKRVKDYKNDLDLLFKFSKGFVTAAIFKTRQGEGSFVDVLDRMYRENLEVVYNEDIIKNIRDRIDAITEICKKFNINIACKEESVSDNRDVDASYSHMATAAVAAASAPAAVIEDSVLDVPSVIAAAAAPAPASSLVGDIEPIFTSARSHHSEGEGGCAEGVDKSSAIKFAQECAANAAKLAVERLYAEAVSRQSKARGTKRPSECLGL